MLILILGLIVFFAIHSVRMLAPTFRAVQLERNEGRWKGIYSLVSLVGLGLIIWGWIQFRPSAPQVYEPPAWGRHVTLLLVWVAFVLAATANMPAGRIRHWVKHPFLTAVILWSLGHLLASGDLASILLFGAFLIYAVVNRLAVVPRGDPAPAVVRPRSDIIALVSGTAFYLIFVLWLHGLLFGVSPLG